MTSHRFGEWLSLGIIKIFFWLAAGQFCLIIGLNLKNIGFSSYRLGIDFRKIQAVGARDNLKRRLKFAYEII